MTTKRAYKLQEFVAHSAAVNCLKIGRKSSRKLVTGGEDHTVNLWAIGKPNAIQSLYGHTSGIDSVTLDASEVLVAAGAASGTIKLWDLEEAKIVRTLTGHRSNCISVNFHPFGEFFASGSRDTNLKIWDIRKKGCIHTYKGHTRGVNVLRFTPDGRWVVSGGEDNVVKVWDLTAGKLLHELKSHEGQIQSLDFHPHEFLLATGSADKTVKFWDLETFELIGSGGTEDTKSLLPLEMVEHLRNGFGSKGQIVHVEDIKARKAAFVEIPDELSEITKAALKRIGINRLYSHQAESISAALSGKNVAVATMTSSGKSLCYNVPVFEELTKDTDACALYLFPTKALAQDQYRALSDLIKGYEASIHMGVYDGDTPYKDRTRLRNHGRLLITNPDMLHMSILPLHGQFSRILSNIRYIVIDEAHTYKGAFGCHTALILRRFRRLCSHVYGTNPSFIFCTATSANPREHCMDLANLSELELIEKDGSPSSEKLFVLWNPSIFPRNKPEETAKAMSCDGDAADQSPSPLSEVAHLFAEMVQHGLRCIAFCRSRKFCELVLCFTREILAKTAPHLVEAISSYRGGYIAEDRRKIESDLFGGKLCGIAATNALELGIDVGHIDVTLHLGFPGSIASLWQQAGRSGRRERPSLALYVAFDGPLDQYFMKFPNKLFRSPIECCHTDSQNQQVVEQHLACAALEHPLSFQYDGKHFGSGLSNAVESLKNRGILSFDPSRDSAARIWTYIGREKKPTQRVSIRAIETERYRVIEKSSNDVLEEIEESKAFFQVYEGAIYMNQGRTYLVESLDTKEKIALCKIVNVDYYTRPRDYTSIHVTGDKTTYAFKVPKNQLEKTTAQAQACSVTTKWFGFYRIRKSKPYGVFDEVELSLPSYSYQSQAVWIQVPESVKSAVTKENLRSGLHAACHALLHVVPLFVRCNYSDLAPECANPSEQGYFPERILLYDRHPGGTGISAQIRPFFTELLKASLDLLTSCCCSAETGCPSCVQNYACHNEVIHKNTAIMIIKGVLEADKLYFQDESSSILQP